MENQVRGKVDDPNKDINDQIKVILPTRMSPDVQNVMKLADVLIAHLRRDNDTGTREEVLANQGGIRALKQLREYCGYQNI